MVYMIKMIYIIYMTYMIYMINTRYDLDDLGRDLPEVWC